MTYEEITIESSSQPNLESALLEVNDITTSFNVRDGIIRAVDEVSFSLKKGETLGIVGESGSGKTILARSIMQLLPRKNVHIEGEILFDNLFLNKLRPKELRNVLGKDLSMVFQDPMSALNPVLKISKQLEEPLRIHLNYSRSEARETAESLLRSVGIPEPEKRLSWYPHQFSGGQRQRILIAMALACAPKLLIADEPTTGLDVTVQAQILDLISEEVAERQMSLILVTHDLSVVSGRCEFTLVMYGGQVVEFGPTAKLRSNPAMPYTEALLGSVPSLDKPPHTKLRAIVGRPPNPLNLPPGCRFAPRCPYAIKPCFLDMPPLIRTDNSTNHFARCWFPLDTPEHRAASRLHELKGIGDLVTGARNTTYSTAKTDDAAAEDIPSNISGLESNIDEPSTGSTGPGEEQDIETWRA